MTTTAAAPRHRRPEPLPSGSAFAGTLGLLRLYLRRDRIVLPLWTLLLSVPLASVYIGSIESVYPTAEQRAMFAATIMASPAQRALYGNVYNDSVGAVGIWKAGIFHTLIAVAVILTVIRHTRAEEDSGRAELIDSTAVGRYASLTAALLLAFGASVATGLIGTAGLLTTDVSPSGSLAFGLALACSGLVFSALAAVAAQLGASARMARGIAFAALGTFFAFRAVGDAGGGELSWLSPLGWSLQMRPFAGDRFWMLVLHLTTTVVLTATAFALLRSRDVGSGQIAERPGRAVASPLLGSPFGLALRLQRASLLGWTVGLCLYALLIGSVVQGLGGEIGNSATIRDIVSRLGGTEAIENAFITISFTFLGVASSALAISSSLRLHSEETSQRGETALSCAVGRIRWAASYFSVAILGSAVAILLAGVVAGITYGVAADDVAGKLIGVLAAAAVQLPAIWLFAAVTVALFGLAPRFTPAAWGVLVGVIALYFLGSVAGMPQWLLDLTPYGHLPHVPGEGFRAEPVVWLLVLDAVLIAVGLAAFRRRDLADL